MRHAFPRGFSYDGRSARTLRRRARLVRNAPRAADGESHQLALRELRYLARFAVVCFLTGRRSALRSLLAELRERIAELAPRSSEREHAEWELVLSESLAFMQVERPFAVQ